jgi:S1-C subfamily serine protease
MGYPILTDLGDEIKITDGIISSKTGYQGDVATYQISAPIQPGNSGGPLFDKSGMLVGITSAGVPGLQNIGYAIKVSYLMNLLDACSEQITPPVKNKLIGKQFTEQIKILSPFIVIIKIK